MTAAAALAGVDYVPTAGGNPTLVVTGSCPGRIEIELDGATPSQGVALLGSIALSTGPSGR